MKYSSTYIFKVSVAFDTWLHISSGRNYINLTRGCRIHCLLYSPFLITTGYLLSFIAGQLLSASLSCAITILCFISITTTYLVLIRDMYMLKKTNSPPQIPDDDLRFAKIRRPYIGILLVESCCNMLLVGVSICNVIYLPNDKEWTFWTHHSSVVAEIVSFVYMFGACVNPYLYLYRHREVKGFLLVKLRGGGTNQIEPDIVVSQSARRKVSMFKTTGELEEFESGRIPCLPLGKFFLGLQIAQMDPLPTPCIVD